MPNRIFTNALKKISTSDRSTTLYQTILLKFLNIKAQSIFKRIRKHIFGTKILDVGTGVGGIAAYISGKGYNVKSIDVDNSSLFKEFPTELYNGFEFPYSDNEFDTAIIIHVLHHCSDRIAVLREAMRVSRRVIFIEDTYRNRLEKLIVSVNDMIANGEYYFHPYSTAKEWDNIIKENSWKEIHKEEYSEFVYGYLYGRYVLFVVEK